MKGYVSVDIPVKSYIKAYITKELGTELKLAKSQHVIYASLFGLMARHQNPEKVDCSCRYSEKIRIYISISQFARRGCNLNNTNVKDWNRFIERLIKHQFYRLMNDLCETLPSFEGNLPYVRKQLGIDIEAWSDDSMKKDYYRYRMQRKMPLLKERGSGFVRREKAESLAF